MSTLKDSLNFDSRNIYFSVAITSIHTYDFNNLCTKMFTFPIHILPLDLDVHKCTMSSLKKILWLKLDPHLSHIRKAHYSLSNS